MSGIVKVVRPKCRMELGLHADGYRGGICRPKATSCTISSWNNETDDRIAVSIVKETHAPAPVNQQHAASGTSALKSTMQLMQKILTAAGSWISVPLPHNGKSIMPLHMRYVPVLQADRLYRRTQSAFFPVQIIRHKARWRYRGAWI